MNLAELKEEQEQLNKTIKEASVKLNSVNENIKKAIKEEEIEALYKEYEKFQPGTYWVKETPTFFYSQRVIKIIRNEKTEDSVNIRYLIIDRDDRTTSSYALTFYSFDDAIFKPSRFSDYRQLSKKEIEEVKNNIKELIQII